MFLQVMAMGQEFNQNTQVRREEEDDKVITQCVNMILFSNVSCFYLDYFPGLGQGVPAFNGQSGTS